MSKPERAFAPSRLPLDHRPHPHRLPHPLKRLLAPVIEPHPPDVRASERTVSDTSTSPATDSPTIREAMFTAPP